MVDAQTCGVTGCRDAVRASGMCQRHYQAARRAIRTGALTEADLEARGLVPREPVVDAIVATPVREEE